jgi:hypothetical protein
MAGEGGAGGSGGFGGGGSGDSGGYGDIGAIIAYLNQRSFGADGDYTGNAGYGGDNTGPPGSKPPEQHGDPAATLVDALLDPGGMSGSSSAAGARDNRFSAADPYDALRTPAGLFDYVGAEVDPFSGLPLGMESPDPFSGLPISDPFVDDWPARARSVMAPFRALRTAKLLSSPDLLADNAVAMCDPTRTSCLPEVRSDANQSSLATSIQADMDESYIAIQTFMEGKAKIVGNTEVDMQKVASTAAQVARSDEYQLAFTANQLRDHPIEIRHSAVLTGLGHVVSGTLVMTASGFIIYGTAGGALPLIGATGLAAGAAEASSGLALAVSGADSTETVRMSGQLDYVFALTGSPASLVFGTTGLVLSGGDAHISHGFALAGSIAEGMMTFRGDPSKLYSTLVPGVGTKAEKATTTLLVKDVAALGATARAPSFRTIPLNRDFTVADLQAIEAFREELAATGRLDLAGIAGHEAAGAAERGVDFAKYRGAFQQELKLHGPYTMMYQEQLDSAWTQSLNYSIKYQLETRAFGEQLVPLRSVKHIWISPFEAVRSVR